MAEARARQVHRQQFRGEQPERPVQAAAVGDEQRCDGAQGREGAGTDDLSWRGDHPATDPDEVVCGGAGLGGAGAGAVVGGARVWAGAGAGAAGVAGAGGGRGAGGAGGAGSGLRLWCVWGVGGGPGDGVPDAVAGPWRGLAGAAAGVWAGGVLANTAVKPTAATALSPVACQVSLDRRRRPW